MASFNQGNSGVQKRFDDDVKRKVFEAVREGNAAKLNGLLQRMNISERTAALKSHSTNVLQESKMTPLILAVNNGNLDWAKVLLSYKADIDGRGFTSCTPLAVAAGNGNLDVLSYLVENGADVNTQMDNNQTPLMIASLFGHENIVTFLVEQGAYIDIQDIEGNTALHLAIEQNDDEQSAEVANKLLAFGASQLYNNERLTPLLLASNNCNALVVENFIKRPECTAEQRIDALELLGASIATENVDDVRTDDRSFQYMKRGMEERFQYPSHPLLKQPMEPIKAYQSRKESQTLEEIAQIEGDVEAILMESLIIRERILGSENMQLVDSIEEVAEYHNDRDNVDICIGLYRHAMKINQHYNQSIGFEVDDITNILYSMVNRNIPYKRNFVIKTFEETVLECTKQVRKFRKELGHEAQSPEEHKRKLQDEMKPELKNLLDSLLRLLQFFAKVELCQEDKKSSVFVLLQKLPGFNLRDDDGNTLLHLTVDCWQSLDGYGPGPNFLFPCPDTMKLLLYAGFDVNAINNNGDTPFHRAVTFKPSDEKFRILTGVLDVLLDGGAHDDLVNNDGKTAMDVAQTEEARRILSERKKLKLKCIAAKAVKNFGLPYWGVVPKTLEEYIRRH